MHAGVGRSSIFDWRAADASFDRAFREAFDSGTDRFEAEARRRALAGSDLLLLFLLKQRDPKRFNQRMVVVSGDPENPIAVQHSGAPDNVVSYLPENHRDRPAPDDDPPRTIEGEAGHDDEAAA